MINPIAIDERTFIRIESSESEQSCLEHFHQIYSDAPLVPRNSGLFGFWLCFSSVAGFSNLRLR